MYIIISIGFSVICKAPKTYMCFTLNLNDIQQSTILWHRKMVRLKYSYIIILIGIACEYSKKNVICCWIVILSSLYTDVVTFIYIYFFTYIRNTNFEAKEFIFIYFIVGSFYFLFFFKQYNIPLFFFIFMSTTCKK